MISAFGVEHGEISKARIPRNPMRGMPGGRRASKAQRATQGTPGAPSGPSKVKSAFNRVGEAELSLKSIGTSAGRGMKATGGFLEKRPGLTGTALVGGGGAAGYHILSQKEPKKGPRR